jgi:prolyl-tRNA synthetase
MAHGDDDGLVLPPAVAPLQIVILPVIRGEGDNGTVLPVGERLREELRTKTWRGAPLRVEMDIRDARGGEKFWEYAKKGVPIRLEIGRREVESGTVTVSRRDQRDKYAMPLASFAAGAGELLEDIHRELLARARRRREEHTVSVKTLEEFRDHFASGNGFVRTYFCGDGAAEEKIREELGVTSRCFPSAEIGDGGPCFVHPNRRGRPMLWARAY